VLVREIVSRCSTATQIKSYQTVESQNSAIEAKFKHFLVAGDQMQTLYSPGEVLPLLRHTGYVLLFTAQGKDF